MLWQARLGGSFAGEQAVNRNQHSWCCKWCRSVSDTSGTSAAAESAQLHGPRQGVQCESSAFNLQEGFWQQHWKDACLVTQQ